MGNKTFRLEDTGMKTFRMQETEGGGGRNILGGGGRDQNF